jgi:serine/threonine protein phosphatase PrpC
MKRIFDYDSKIVEDLFFHESAIENTDFRISACTVPNADGKPNEDSFSVVAQNNLLWIGLFDGTTSLKDLKELKGISGAKYASSFLKSNFFETQQELLLSPKQKLLSLNGKLLEASIKIGGNLEDTHSLPAAMATIMKIDLISRSLEIAHVGDTWVIAFANDGTSQLITEDRNRKFDNEMFDLIKKVAVKKGITYREARNEEIVKKSLYEMYRRRNNNPDSQGSGLVNGDPNIELYIQEKKIDLTNQKAILMGTDGLEIQGYQLDDESYRNMLLDKYLDGAFKKLVDLKRKSEDSDPTWKYLRYKHSDDATGIMLLQ